MYLGTKFHQDQIIISGDITQNIPTADVGLYNWAEVSNTALTDMSFQCAGSLLKTFLTPRIWFEVPEIAIFEGKYKVYKSINV